MEIAHAEDVLFVFLKGASGVKILCLKEVVLWQKSRKLFLLLSNSCIELIALAFITKSLY